jgi:drug/metabolite transporter (DMT)-like permease
LSSRGHLTAYLALAAVCFFWGTTYLAIRMALESFSPAVLMASRFLLSGTILLAAARLSGARIPRGRELWLTMVFGLMVLGIGNGCLTLAETIIPSGLAALIITTSPFWLVGLDAWMPGGARLHGPTLVGMLVGLAGAALLVVPDIRSAAAGGNIWKGFLVLQLGCIGWTSGSLLQRRLNVSAHPIVAGAIQQVAAGLAYVIPAVLDPTAIHWSGRGAGALLYLVVFGSIVGYSAYIYALEHLPVAVVGIYNYVNPVVAVTLGWLFYRESFGWREAIAMAIIFVGVAIVKRFA